jgi:FkbM family methyltransferase
VAILRRGTFDASIWSSVDRDYPALPASFEPGELLLDVGCHTGAVCQLAADRGATVVGYEANFENYALATINLHGLASVSLHHAAVWRSDVTDPGRLVFTPSADPCNTGGGSVLFATVEDHWATDPAEGADRAPPGAALSSHEIEAVAIDEILVGLGPVHFLKLDAEGAEFPILLTATRLDMVTTIGGEYHELTEAGMASLAPCARVGDERYTADLLGRCLAEAGFDEVKFVPDVAGRGFFTARRVTGGR